MSKIRNSDILTPKQASKILNVNSKTLKRWAKSGKIREVRLPSGFSRYYREDLLNMNGQQITKEVSKEGKKQKLSLSTIILILWLYIKGLFK